MMNETIKTLLERRSVRGYKKDLVPAEILNQILEAGEYAPSGMGMQGTVMVVTQNPELVAKLSQMNAAVMGSGADPFYGAPAGRGGFYAGRGGENPSEYPEIRQRSDAGGL